MVSRLVQRHFIRIAAKLLQIVSLFVTGGTCVCADVTNTVVFKSGQDSYHTYRIPTIVRAKNGDLLAFAEGRKKATSDNGDIDIVLKRSSDGGKSWGRMQLVQDEPGDPAAKVWIGNPTPIVDRTDPMHPGRIWLVFTRSNERMFVTFSDDNGKSWAERRDITETAGKPAWRWYAAGPVHGIQLERGPHAGRLVAPCDHRMRGADSWGAHLIYSDDHGATWKLGATDTHLVADPVHPNECVAVELVDGRIYVNARDQNGSDPASRLVAYSSDGGETFDGPFAPEPNITSPVVQNSCVRLYSKDRGDEQNVLVYCGCGHPTQRRDLTVLASFDEGKTWGRKTVVHTGPAAYCDLVKLDGDRVGVLFEAGKKLYGEIEFATFGLEDLKKP
jgi:sialidase-1